MSAITPGPFNHLKSSLLGSTSDSHINKYSTINKIPLIALNFSEGNERKAHSPPASEKTIIAPKVKDRTHNVTDKVTQVRKTLKKNVLIATVVELSVDSLKRHVHNPKILCEFELNLSYN